MGQPFALFQTFYYDFTCYVYRVKNRDRSRVMVGVKVRVSGRVSLVLSMISLSKTSFAWNHHFNA